ncbi:MAG: N-6 DNA methylase [Planctomycetota bacterium]
MPRPKHAPGKTPTAPALARHIARLALQPLLDAPSSRPLRVLDPAVGEGVFLLAVRELLADWPGPVTLVGVDLDAQRLAVARGLLGDDAELREADALDRATWTDEPPADVLLMNPPWISYGNRQTAGLGEARRAMLRESFALGFAGFPSSHGPFLELAADLTADHGWLGVIVPEQVAHLPGYRGAREALQRRHSLRHVERVGDRAFEGVNEPAVILVLGPGTADPAPAHDDWMARAVDHQSAVVGFHTPTSASAASVIAAIDRLPVFAAQTFADIGVHTGGMASAVIARGTTPPDDDGATWQPCRRGKDVRLVTVGPPSEWLRTAPPVAVPAGTTPARWRPLERYIATPVLVRQTADRPIAALHATGEPTFFRNSVLAAGDPTIEPRALTIILCSAAFAFIHRHRWPDARQRTQPQVKVRHLRALPSPPLPADIAAGLVACADRLIARADPLDVIETDMDALLADWLALSQAQAATVRDATEPWSRMPAART